MPVLQNSTSVVGYIAFLMIMGVFFGGENGQHAKMRASVLERGQIEQRADTAKSKSAIVTIDGVQYQAILTPIIQTETARF